MKVLVGLDLVRVADVEESLRDHGDAYVRRVFTEHEAADCAGRAERLAARFAAKEAALKALRVPADEALPLTAVEVVRDADGVPSIALHGPAAALAERRGVGELSLSFTHEHDVAAAVVVALVDG
jgi:holo-[acyl-carrier protein] synthase